MTKRAIVIGGSIAGLTAAAAIRPFFDRVTIVERDVLDDSQIAPRRGVPQSPFVHSLLERGRRELEALFPGFTDAMLAAGVPVLDFGSDIAALRETGWIKPGPVRLRTLWPSRALLETTVRRLCRQQYDIEFITGAAVSGLTINRSGDVPRTTGIVLRGDDGTSEELAAQIVVDASGRGSPALAWLQKHGIDVPAEDRVDAQAGYSARMYRAPDPSRLPRAMWWKGIVIECQPPSVLVGGVLLPIEDQRWLVTLMGFNAAYPPTSNDEFEEFARNLRSPILGEAIAMAEPLGDVVATRGFVNRFRRYDRWTQRLRGFVATGDSVCSFNPIYGQGMSTAAVSATIIRDALANGGADAPDFADRCHVAQGAFLAIPWNASTASDFAYPGTIGERPHGDRWRGLYLNALFESAWQDHELHRRVVQVFHLIAPPETYFAPSTMARAFAGTVARGLRRLTSTLPTGPRPPHYERRNAEHAMSGRDAFVRATTSAAAR